MARSRLDLLRLLLAAGVTLACERVPRPWDSPDGATPVDAALDGVSDKLDLTGCGADGDVAVGRVWSLIYVHALTPSAAFRRCLDQSDFSPSPAAFTEEIIDRLRDQRPVASTCGELSGDGAHGLIAVTPYGGPLRLTFSRTALAAETPVRMAAAAVHQLLHHERYDHYGTDDGEGRWGVPALAERCMLAAAGEAEPTAAPPLLARDEMVVEGEPQPFGVVRPWAADPFYLECPPGTWAVGQGIALRRLSSASTTDHVTALGLRCQARTGGATVDVGTEATQWAGCGLGRVAVGVRADANVNGLYSARFLCADWAAVGDPARATEPVELPRNPGGFVIERRCPAGQALFALSGALDTPAWVLSLALRCHHVDVSRVGDYTELAAVGASTYPGTRLRRVGRCADQGVLTGFFGHRRHDEQGFSRLGGICRSTAWVGGALRFRSVSAGTETPEHPAPGAGGDPNVLEPAADPFDRLPAGAGRGRCPAGMGVVGVRVRAGGAFGVMQHLQVLCAPLDAWMSASPPAATRATVAGDWAVDDPTGTQTVQCPPGRFMAGFEVRQFSVATAAEVIERLAPLCRDFRPAP